MSKRFVVLLGSETEEQVKAFQKVATEKGLALWHWLPNSWLIVDPTNTFEATTLRTQFQRIYPNVYLLVTQIKGDDFWSGYGPATEEKNMFKWLSSTWKIDKNKPVKDK